jgi:hypothetical protein
MAKIRQSNLDNAVITGLTELAEGRADGDFAVIYDASSGTLKKIQASNLGVVAPVVSSVSPTSVLTGDGTGNATFTITGQNFAVGATAVLITDGGSEVAFDSVTRDSSTQLTCVIALSSLSNANEPYDVKVTASGLSNTLADQININAQPSFNTASGSLGTVFDGGRTGLRFVIDADDPESAGNVTYELQSGTLPGGLSLSNESVDGGIGVISGTADAVGGNTTYNFVIRAVDAASNTSSRAFSITVNAPVAESFTSSGTFSVPSGLTEVTVLVIGGGGSGRPHEGGGGGAGGLIYRPGFPVTPGGTVSVTVGCGGASNPAPTRNATSGQDSAFGTLTAKGGGGGQGQSGGSGGGGADYCGGSGGPGTQPTQPGDSGAYGFGNPGGPGQGAPTYLGGGGGGAGAAGVLAHGGAEKSYNISGSCTGYAGGGGAGATNSVPGPTGGFGGGNFAPTGGFGSGNGGNAPGPGAPGACSPGQSAQANKGSGGGGGDGPSAVGGAGGKGIVIVQY